MPPPPVRSLAALPSVSVLPVKPGANVTTAFGAMVKVPVSAVAPKSKTVVPLLRFRSRLSDTPSSRISRPFMGTGDTPVPKDDELKIHRVAPALTCQPPA